jgi:peptide/nickel transport system permease protein
MVMPPTESTPSPEERAPASQPAAPPVRGPDLGVISSKPLTMRALVWRRYKRHVPAMISSGALLLLIVVAIFAPQVTGSCDPYANNLKHFRAPPGEGYPLGTDTLGRDVFCRLVYASRVSLSVGLVAVSISLLIGTILGVIAGYAGGPVDSFVMRLSDVVLSFPLLMIIIVIVSVVGPSVYNVMVVIGLLSWPTVGRLVRGNVLSLREQEFVIAARASGVPAHRIALRHILPNTMAAVVVAGTFGVATAILIEAGLSFLGLGVQPPMASWGNMLIEAQSLTILETMPWLWIPPGLMIALAVLSINFVGDGLRDALDPRSLVD